MKSVILFLLVIPQIGFSQLQDVEVNLTMGNLKQPASILLLSGQKLLLDSCYSKTGKFKLKGLLPGKEPQRMELKFSGSDGFIFDQYLGFMACPGKINIAIDTVLDKRKKKTMQFERTPIFDYVQIEDPLNLNRDIADEFDAHAKLYAEEYKLFLAPNSEAGADTKLAVAKRVQGIQDNEQNHLNITKAWIKKHPNSYASILLMEKIMDPFSSDGFSNALALMNGLSPAMQNSAPGKAMLKRLPNYVNTKVGKTAPNFSVLDINGKPVSLSDFKGKYVLLDFWASWCHACRAENPNLTKAYAQYKDKGFEILYFSMDNTKEPWVQAVKEDKLTWTQVSFLEGADKNIDEKYMITRLPANFLIDPTGKIIDVELRGEGLNNKLKEIFDNKN